MLWSQNFERADFGFSIDGNEKSKALLGGLNRPLVDDVNLDGDPEQELVVFDIDGSVVLTFERVDDEWVLNDELRSNFPSLHDWVFFRDFNNDGITDIFTQADNPFTYGIQVYQGSLEGGLLHFELIELEEDQYNLLFYYDDLLNKRYVPVSPTNLPAIEDFDGDGDLDVLSFNAGGFYAEYYENQSVEQGTDPADWILIQESACWGNFYETGNAQGVFLNEPCEGTPTPAQSLPAQEKVHGSAGFAAFDRDADGDFDVVLSDVTRDSLIYLENGGTPDNGNITAQETNFPAESVVANTDQLPYPSFLDVNNDGREDMLITPLYFSSENVEVGWYYENTGTTNAYQFTLIEKDWLVKDMIDLGKGSDPCFVDYNQDGLMDIVVGTTGYYVPLGGADPRLFLFLNVGNPSTPIFELADDDLLDFSQWGNESWGFSPAFGDLDGDNDLDLLVGDFNGALHYLENNAGPNNPMTFEEDVYPFMGIDTTVSIGQNATPFIYDFNQDGLGDIFLGGDRGMIRYFENQGDESGIYFDPDPMNAPNQETWGDITLQVPGVEKGYSSPALVKTNGQIHFFTGSEYGSLISYESFSEDSSPETLAVSEENYGFTREGQYVRPDFADLDADGFLEVVIGNQRGGLSIYHTDLALEGSDIASEPLSISLFPNPVDEVLFVNSAQALHSAMIYDSSGKLVRSVSGALTSISFANLASGIYLLELRTMDGAVSLQKILKH